MQGVLKIRLKTELPVVVDGGITRWKIAPEWYGKNGGKLAIVAECVTTGQRITLLDGRDSAVRHSLADGLSARRGTIEAKIYAKLVRTGRAEVI